MKARVSLRYFVSYCRSQEHSEEVSVNSNLPFFFVGPSITTSDWSFLPTCSNHLSGLSCLLSKGV